MYDAIGNLARETAQLGAGGMIFMQPMMAFRVAPSLSGIGRICCAP